MLAVSFAASASSFSLTCGGSPCGSVTVTQVGTNEVMVSLTMLNGFTQKVQDGADFDFNTSASMVTISNLMVSPGGLVSGTFNGTNFGAGGTATATADSQNVDGQGTFDYLLSKIGTTSHLQPTTSVITLSFDLTGSGLMASNFSNFTIHYCSPGSGGGFDTSCPAPTGFAASTAVPEPGSMALLGTGLLGVAGMLWRRRRFHSAAL